MNTKSLPAITAALVAVAAPLHAGPRSSASYNVPAETVDAGGRRTASASYGHDGSIGGIGGDSTVPASSTRVTAGYIAQISEAITGLVLSAVSGSVNENATVQLSAIFVLEDGSFSTVPATDVAWSVLTGPLTGITAGGLATAGTVYQNTPASVRGSYNGQSDTLALTVLDSSPDNFGSYAGDGIADSWQAQYFGLDNPAAAPSLDPDGDGQINLFEFTAGVVPTDPQSRFRLRLDPVPGQLSQKNAVFSPVVAGRNYTVEFTTSLTAGPWAPLPGTTQSDNGSERTVTDPNATGPRKFYRVEVEKP